MTNRIYGTIEFQSLTAKILFFILQALFKLLNVLLWGQDFQEAFLKVFVHVFEIIWT